LNVDVRKAEIADIEILQEFAIKTFRDSFEKHNSPENMELYIQKSFSREQISLEMNEPRTEFYLAYIDERLVGYAKVIVNKSIEGLNDQRGLEIERIYVDQEFHGKQIGKVLLDKCLYIARINGVNVVWLGVWEHNHRAFSFYKKSGFEKFGEHVFMLGNDAQTDWLMKKSLS
jgi:ribosomal protein S18 acetylase RimI-like enzyme